MSHRIAGTLAGVLLLVLGCAATAVAAGPARVTFRAEGPSDTLVPSTSLTTSTTPVVKDGNPQHACSGTSAAGALEQGTAGQWTGTWSDQYQQYFVDTIKGVTPASGDYFTFWLNNKEASVGACDAQLQPGDDVLFFYCKGGAAPPNYACSNLPLGVEGAPQSVRFGQSFTVQVVQYDGRGGSTPVPGATVHGGRTDELTGPDGRVTITPPSAGELTISATKAAATPSGDHTVCVNDGNDGTCGTSDHTAPRVQIENIDNGERFGRRHGPRTLRGTAYDASGIRGVGLRVQRRAGRRCYAFDGRRERFVRRGCRWGRPPFFSIGDRQDWSYLLPERLPPGRYVLDAVARDKFGNRSGLKVGASRVVFTVAGR